MKNILFGLLILLSGAANGQQVRRDTGLQHPQTIYGTHPGQFPNYYQNNSMFSNNSMQYNPPPNPKAGPYTGNADYSDPTRSIPGPVMFNSPNTPAAPIVPNNAPNNNK